MDKTARCLLAALLSVSPAALALDVRGQVQTPLQLSVAGLKALPAKTVDTSFHTIHGDDHHAWTGALLIDIIGKAGLRNDDAKSAALRHVIIVHARDGYETALAYGEIDPDAEGKPVLLAYQRDAEPLPEPRLIVPGDKGGPRQVHDVTSIEIR
jgi:DMSO/TMAO reductase YedYZ molybdopterin-dependent catalytic subunit